jgi:hypothetical protein
MGNEESRARSAASRVVGAQHHGLAHPIGEERRGGHSRDGDDERRRDEPELTRAPFVPQGLERVLEGRHGWVEWRPRRSAIDPDRPGIGPAGRAKDATTGRRRPIQGMLYAPRTPARANSNDLSSRPSGDRLIATRPV